jgi:hypothetical protein
MKYLKSYTSVSELKRTPAFYGPYKPKISRGQKVAGVLLAVAIGVGIGTLLVLELSK